MDKDAMELDIRTDDLSFDGGWDQEGLGEEHFAPEEPEEVGDPAAVEAQGGAEPPAEAAEEEPAPDFSRFISEHPELSAEDIPDEVWRGVMGGESLSEAWTRHENRLLKARLFELEQENRNRLRSTGSRRSAGVSRPYDPFDDGWGQE